LFASGLVLDGASFEEMMRGYFDAVEAPEKIAMRVLPRRRTASLIFRPHQRLEFIVSR